MLYIEGVEIVALCDQFENRVIERRWNDRCKREKGRFIQTIGNIGATYSNNNPGRLRKPVRIKEYDQRILFCTSD